MPHFTNLGDLIRRDRDLSKVAIIDLGGEQVPREFSYARLDAMANGVARALIKRGLARGDRVAILSANRAEYLAAYYGIMRAGLVAVPVNFKFPATPSISSSAMPARSWCSAIRRAARTFHPTCPSVHFGGDGPDGFDRFLDPGSFEPIVPQRASPRCSCTRRARPERRRASCSRTRATSGWWRRG